MVFLFDFGHICSISDTFRLLGQISRELDFEEKFDMRVVGNKNRKRFSRIGKIFYFYCENFAIILIFWCLVCLIDAHLGYIDF